MRWGLIGRGVFTKQHAHFPIAHRLSDVSSAGAVWLHPVIIEEPVLFASIGIRNRGLIEVLALCSAPHGKNGKLKKISPIPIFVLRLCIPARITETVGVTHGSDGTTIANHISCVRRLFPLSTRHLSKERLIEIDGDRAVWNIRRTSCAAQRTVGGAAGDGDNEQTHY
jgi:hypothetical protein